VVRLAPGGYPGPPGVGNRTAFLQTAVRRPLSSSRWIKPPPICRLNPRSHKIRRTTKMVQSMLTSSAHSRAPEYESDYVRVRAVSRERTRMQMMDCASPHRLSVAATSAPATAFHLADRGRITPGLRADLLPVKVDPTTNIRATRDILAIWKTGASVDRQAWLQLVKPHRTVESTRRRSRMEQSSLDWRSWVANR